MHAAQCSLSYDAANRVTSIVYKDSSNTTDQTLTLGGYDSVPMARAVLTSASDRTIRFVYVRTDGLGRVTLKAPRGIVSLSEATGYSSVAIRPRW